MSVQEDITTRRAKSIILNHWIYNYLPFGTIFSGIRLSSFTPILLWGLTWLILWSISSTVSPCDREKYRVGQLLCIKLLSDEHPDQYKPDRSFINQDDYDEWLINKYYEVDKGAAAKQFFDLLMFLNLPGLMGGMVSAYTIKSARKKQDQINNEE
jgi:hypothetical protein